MNNDWSDTWIPILVLALYFFIWRLAYLRVKPFLHTSLRYSIFISLTVLSVALYSYIVVFITGTFLPLPLQQAIIPYATLVFMLGCMIAVPALATSLVLWLIHLIRKKRVA